MVNQPILVKFIYNFMGYIDCLIKRYIFWDITKCSLSKVKKGDIILQNVGLLSTKYTALYPRR
jgi:hypothetical protein